MRDSHVPFPNRRLLHASPHTESFLAAMNRPVVVAVTPLLMDKSRAGCVCSVFGSTDYAVPAPTTHPAKADGRQCCPLAIDACLFLSFRVTDPRQHIGRHGCWSNFDHPLDPGDQPSWPSDDPPAHGHLAQRVVNYRTLAHLVVARPAKRLHFVAPTPLLMGQSLDGCVCGVCETTDMVVLLPAGTAHFKTIGRA